MNKEIPHPKHTVIHIYRESTRKELDNVKLYITVMNLKSFPANNAYIDLTHHCGSHVPVS